MKVSRSGRRQPAFRFYEFDIFTDVSPQNALDNWMNSNVDEPLINRQQVIDDVPVSFLFITFDVVPANMFQPCIEGPLHG